jgi:hypothetical protein
MMTAVINIHKRQPVSTHRGRARDWQRWAPYAAVVWSLVYAAMGLYWALGGRGFPYPAGSDIGPVAGRFGPAVAWIVVVMAGIPAAALGMVMLRGMRGRVLRPLMIAAGYLLAGVLLLLMTMASLNSSPALHSARSTCRC